MATTTATFGWTKPSKSDLGWWISLNNNFDGIDTQLASIWTLVNTTYFPGGSLHVAGFNMTNSQGAWITWNRGGVGEVDLISHQGAGTGGFQFFTTANASAFGHLATIAHTATESETTLSVGRVGGAVYSVAKVYQGTSNSAGSGFRVLAVPN